MKLAINVKGLSVCFVEEGRRSGLFYYWQFPPVVCLICPFICPPACHGANKRRRVECCDPMLRPVRFLHHQIPAIVKLRPLQSNTYLQKKRTRVIKCIVQKPTSEPWSNVQDENEKQRSRCLCYLSTMIELAQGYPQFKIFFHPFKHAPSLTHLCAHCTCTLNTFGTFHL